MRILRWLMALVFGLLVTLGLAAGIAVGIQALLPLMTTEWIDDRWLKPLSLTTMVFSFLALTMLAVREYRRRRGLPIDYSSHALNEADAVRHFDRNTCQAASNSARASSNVAAVPSVHSLGCAPG